MEKNAELMARIDVLETMLYNRDSAIDNLKNELA